MTWIGRLAAVAAGVGGAVGLGYLGVVSGAVAVDTGLGRRTRGLGPQVVDIDAPREVVFDVVAQPYLGRSTRAMREKIQVLERGEDLVLAAHVTPVTGRLKATTVETVRFSRPDRVDFRLVRGPVAAVTESFVLTEQDSGTRLEYRGELGTDGWRPGEWWGRAVARRWEDTVAESLSSLRQEAQRRAGR